MAISNPKAAYRQGALDAAPFILVAVPFAMVFGLLAVEAGLPVVQVMVFSGAVIAGAAQFTALGLMTDGAPTVIVLLTALAVNLRMAMYSAALAPWLGPAPLWQRAIAAFVLFDQTYAASALRFEENPDWSVPTRMAYYAGSATPVVPAWLIGTFLGAVTGSALPDWLALDFAVPICFLALIGPMLRTPAHVAAAMTSVVLAIGLAWMPYSLGLIVAGIGAMLVGAEIDRRMSR